MVSLTDFQGFRGRQEQELTGKFGPSIITHTLAANPIQILLVYDHQIVLESLALLLSRLTGVSLAGKLSNDREALQLLQNQQVDIILTNLQRDDHTGIDLCLRIQQIHPNCQVIFLIMAENIRLLREAIRSGAAGLLSRHASQDELVHTLQTVASGKKYFSEATVLALIQASQEDDQSKPANPMASLTPREIEVLRLVGQEYSTAEIADQLCLSLSTIESNRRSLMQKLGVKSAVGLGIYAATRGLVDGR